MRNRGDPRRANAPPDATNSAGLGARFNANTCTIGCHSQPALGGTSPALNPSFAVATAKGATNQVPFFETIDGPTREVRFLFNPDGSRDGGVHQKFTVAGRSDAPRCTLAQPDFEAQRGNLAFRIPTQLFGLGLIDSIQDREILDHKNSNLARKAALGIHGTTNNSDASAERGLEAFNQIGCNECHTPSMTTKDGDRGPQSPALRGQTAHLFSDLLVHHMGHHLADNIIQGNAGPDQFRSAPLWGIGQRIFFLHDGRTKSLVDAIFAHYSAASAAHGNTPAYPASEANQVVQNFANLSDRRQQDLLNFLRAL